MTKNELERTIMLALDELETAIQDAQREAIRYGQGKENMAFEVGFLQSRIKLALYQLQGAGLMSNKRLFSTEDEGPKYDSAGFSVADRMEDWDDYIACTDQDNQRYEDSHHCDNLDCNCSI